jgi:dipeptidyl aminopeptidase/acylaminoacyl peptidase
MISSFSCKSIRVFVAVSLLAGCAPILTGQQAQTPRRDNIQQVLDSLNPGRSLGQVAISPDGKRLAWVEGGRRGGEIRVASILGSGNSESLGKDERAIAAMSEADCVESGLTWAPDSSALAFLSSCKNQGSESAGQTELYLSRLDGSAARRLTELKGYVEDPAFSPDGKSVAFLYVEGATRPSGALAAMKPSAGVIGEDGVEIQRVAVVGIDTRKPVAPVFATPARLHVYEFDWAPDSKSLAYVAANPPGENNWWVAKLYTGPLGGEAKAILAPAEVSGPLHGLQIAVPRWSPDGKAIAFIGGLMSDQGSTGGDVWIVAAQGGQPHNLTPQRQASPSWMTWDGNDGLFVNEIAGGNTQLVRLRLEGDRAGDGVSAVAGKPVFSFPGDASDGRIELSLSGTADRSQFVFNAGSFDRPTETYAVKTDGQSGAASENASLIQLTHINEGLKPAWGKTVSLDWTNDGYRVQGWLMFPKNYDPSKKYPLIVEVHGGPSAAVMGRWGGGAGGISATAFSAFDYFVLLPNPRGSFGQGEAFTQANRKDFGYGDLRDILAGVDVVLKQYPVDPKRVGLTGWSYGGFMTMFAVTQTDRFRAAVAGAGISNWQSYYGENSIDQWMTPFFGAPVYDDPQVYAKSSAITYIKNAHTPTLAVVGDRDGECPAPQSFEFWHALRSQHIPAQLVVYPNEGHRFVDQTHRRDVTERALGWFERYMPAE